MSETRKENEENKLNADAEVNVENQAETEVNVAVETTAEAPSMEVKPEETKVEANAETPTEKTTVKAPVKKATATKKKKADKVKRYFKAKNSRLLAIILLSIMLPAMVFVVAPYEIYCNNIGELSFSAKEFIGILGSFSLLVSILLFCLLYFIPDMVYRFVYPLIFGILLMLFLQTNYLNGDMNSLAGDGMDSKIPTFTYVWNTSLWLIVIIAFIVLFQFVKLRNIVKLVSLILTIAISATQIMNFTITTLNTKEGPFKSAIDRIYGEYEDRPRFLTYKDIDTVATDQNVIFICVDRMDGLLYAEPAMEKYPELFDKLDGFTYYSDFVSMYGYTFPSVAYMMSGMKYDNGSQREFFKRVYNENQTINTLHDDYGYNVHLYSESYYDYYNANELPAYVGNAMETDKDTVVTKVRRPWRFGITLAQTALYRSLPFLMKDLVGNIDSETFNGFIYYESEDLQGEKNYHYDTSTVHKEILKSDGNFTTKGEKNFSFIHFSGCHAKEGNNAFEKTDQSIKVSDAKKSMELVIDYLDNMKQVSPDIYRNSTIVIMADHGVVDARHEKLSKPMLSACFVKPAGVADSDLVISDAPVSVSNIWATIFQSEGLAYDRATLGDSFFEIEAAHKATGVYPIREFVWTRRNKSLTEYDSITYEITGKARDFANWSIAFTEHVDHPLFAH